MRHTRSICLALVGLVLLALSGTAQAAEPKAACKHGGYVGYVDPATGRPFTTQGRCVSFVVTGGTLVPVVGAPAVGGYEPDQARWPVYGQCDDPLGLWYQVSILYGETDVTLPIAPPPECA
jgi:hypothetical protein